MAINMGLFYPETHMAQREAEITVEQRQDTKQGAYQGFIPTGISSYIRGKAHRWGMGGVMSFDAVTSWKLALREGMVLLTQQSGTPSAYRPHLLEPASTGVVCTASKGESRDWRCNFLFAHSSSQVNLTL